MAVTKLSYPAKENAVQEKINEIIDNMAGTITVDQTYDGTSANAQSGVAIAGELTKYAQKAVDTDITGVYNFKGQKKIKFTQSSSSDKLGFTLYNNNNVEKGYLEYNPTNTVDSVPLMTLGNYATASAGLTHVGFRKYSSISGANGAYNLLAPLISDAKTPFSLTTTYTNFYLPLGFTDGVTTVKTAKTGLVDLSSILPTVGNGTITINQGGTQKGTFTVNQSGNTTINLDAGGGGGGTVDQTYDPTSANAQSGVAINGAKFVQNTATGTNSLTLLGTATSSNTAINIGYNSSTTTGGTVAIGTNANTSGTASISIGANTESSGIDTIAIGDTAKATANNAIQIGYGTNNTANKFNVRSYELLDLSTGYIPDARISSNIARTSDIPSITVDQTYDSTSANAQSGVAINGANFLQNTSTQSNSIVVGGTVNNKNLAVCIGDNSTAYVYCTAIGASATTTGNYQTVLGYNSKASGTYSTALGEGSYANGGNSTAVGASAKTSATGAVAIGNTTTASGNNATCIGYQSQATDTYASALGCSAKATANSAIQLGYGTNSTANTLSVGFHNSSSTHYIWQLLDGTTGLIPDARISSNIARTSAIPDVSSYLQNTATGLFSLTILGTAQTAGNGTNVGHSTSAGQWSNAFGNSAKATGKWSEVFGGNITVSGDWSVGIGHNNDISGNYTVAIGANLGGSSYETTGNYATCLGCYSNATADSAVQIGYGINSTANSLSIGFYNNSTTHYNWQLLDGTTGLIPDARISSNIARTSQIVTPTYDSTNERITW